jgi:hypothetical protein
MSQNKERRLYRVLSVPIGLPHRLERHFPVKTAVYFGVGRIRARGDMRANGRIPRPGNADLREVAAQWRRLAEDAEAKERYNQTDPLPMRRPYVSPRPGGNARFA